MSGVENIAHEVESGVCAMDLPQVSFQCLGSVSADLALLHAPLNPVVRVVFSVFSGTDLVKASNMAEECFFRLVQGFAVEAGEVGFRDKPFLVS